MIIKSKSRIVSFICFVFIIFTTCSLADFTADTFNCTNLEDLTINFEIPKGQNIHKVILTIDINPDTAVISTGPDATTFSIEGPGVPVGGYLLTVSDPLDYDTNPGDDNNGKKIRLSSTTPGVYKLIIRQKPTSLPRGTVNSGTGNEAWVFSISGLDTSVSNGIDGNIESHDADLDTLTGPGFAFIASDPCPNLPPTAAITSPTGPQTIIAGERIDFAGSATDEDQPSLKYEWDFGTGASPITSDALNPGSVTFNYAGTYNVEFRVTDNANNVATDNVLIAVNVNNPPTIAMATPLTAIVGTQLSFTVVSSDDNPQPAQLDYKITSSAPNIPAVGSIVFLSGTGDFTYTPPLSDAGGSFTVTFTAKDSIKSDLQAALDVIIEVEQVNNPPVINPIPSPRTAYVGYPLTIDVEATDDTTPVLSADIYPSPTGTHSFVDNGSGTWLFTFTPAGLDQGRTFTVRFVAEDSQDPHLKDTQCVAINVVPHIEINPSGLYFSVLVGDTSEAAVVTIGNRGNRKVELHVIPPVFYPNDRGKFDVTFKNRTDPDDPYNFDNPVYTYLLPGDSDVTLGVRYTALRECDTNKSLMIRCGSLGYDVNLHGKGLFTSQSGSVGISYGNTDFFRTIPYEGGDYCRLVFDYLFPCRWFLELFLNANFRDFYYYGLNLGYMLPIKSTRLKPYLSLGVGLVNFNKTPEGTEYKDKERSLAVNIGAGFRWYPSSKRRLGFLVELKDLVLFNAFDTGVTHNLQYSGGIIINFGKTK